MTSRSSVGDRRTFASVLFAALPLMAILRSLFVRSCDTSGMGLHEPLCYRLLPWTAIVRDVLIFLLASIVLGLFVDRFVVDRLPARARARSPSWFPAPSNLALAVVVALLSGLVLLAISDPQLSVYYSFETDGVGGTLELLAGWGLYVPTTGLLFGGNFVVALVRGMVGVDGLVGWSLAVGILLVSSLLQLLWLYAVAAGAVGGYRRVRRALGRGTSA